MKNFKKIVALFGIIGMIFISCSDDDPAANETCGANAEIVAETIFNDVSISNYSIVDVNLTGDCLEIKISTSGCSANELQMNLYSTDSFYTVYPYQRGVKLKLFNNQLCLAIIEKTNRYRRLGRPKTKIVLPLSNEYKGEIYRCEFNNI